MDVYLYTKVFCLRSNDVLDEEMLGKIRTAGYSRIPVCRRRSTEQEDCDPHHVCGFVLTKHLITANPKVR